MINNRGFERIRCDIRGTLETQSSALSCEISDVSKTGIGGRYGSFFILNVGQKVTVVLGDVFRKTATIKWIGSGKFGAEFKTPLSSTELAAFIARIAA